MSAQLQHHLQVAMNREGVVGRRDFLRAFSAAGLTAGALNWTDRVSAHAAELRKQQMACILLWMPGGPSQFETLDPKPGHANGGETKAIATNVSGIQIADNLPEVAKIADKLAIIRSLTTKEGNHQRASYLLHTSYVPLASVRHPAMGSVAARQLRDLACQLPAFVRIGERFQNSSNGGLLGNEFDAFVVSSPDRTPDNARPTSSTERYEKRLSLLERMEAAGPAAESSLKDGAIHDHAKLYEHASRMILSPQMDAFNLDREDSKTREAYGRSTFGNACLLARRLVESGVTFVEASLPNWDTHDNNFDRHRTLCGQLDRPFAALVRDLDQRGMLDRTLVIWMGEFGRTPRINPRGGRDHFPRAFNAALAGGGIRGGQVIGSTDAGGDEVKDRPISEKDLFQTVYRSLGIDPAVEVMSPIGRPIKFVDGGKPVQEAFG